ncbi:MAG: hypothetical protein OQK51_06890 [Kangiellaceae bacterium]|nr:hypothetical protein [Kangiellaceae bacterium]
MSILLESLSQKEETASPDKKDDVPGLHSTHFDDEMLDDEWLLRKLKMWRLVSIASVILLTVSWIYFIFNWSTSEQIVSDNITESNIRQQKQATPENKPLTKEIASTENGAAQKTEVEKESVRPNNLTSQETEVVPGAIDKREVYQPKKREAKLHSQPQHQSQTRKDKPSGTVSVSAENITNLANNQRATFLLEELPSSIQQDFPELTLGSYVIADEKDKSFIILNSSFYKVNQVIAPEMVLRDITQQHILVEFRSYLVKIPHSG